MKIEIEIRQEKEMESRKREIK